jgi:hypothetical protein
MAFWQTSPLGQASQTPPWPPQVEAVTPSWHWPLLSQQPEQFWASQVLPEQPAAKSSPSPMKMRAKMRVTSASDCLTPVAAAECKRGRWI